MRALLAGLCLALLGVGGAGAQTPPPDTVGAPAADAPATTSAPSADASTTPPPSHLQAQAGGGVGQLDIELQPQKITIGDRVETTLTLVWMGPEPSEPPRFPTWQDTWGDAEVLDVGEVESSVDGSGRRLYRQRLVLTAFDVGDVELPAVTVVIPLPDDSAEIRNAKTAAFSVSSVRPPEPAAAEGEGEADSPGDVEKAPLEAKPPAPPRALPQQASFYWTVGALGLLTLAAALLLLRRSREFALAGGGSHSIPQLPPLEALLRHLDGVQASAGSERVHTAISLSLRHYLGRRLAWNAAGSTTSEIQRQLRRGPVPDHLSQRLLQLFKACDQVKFARQEVSAAVNEDRLAQARDLGRQLEPLLAPPPLTSSGAAPGRTTPGNAATGRTTPGNAAPGNAAEAQR